MGVRDGHFHQRMIGQWLLTLQQNTCGDNKAGEAVSRKRKEPMPAGFPLLQVLIEGALLLARAARLAWAPRCVPRLAVLR